MEVIEYVNGKKVTEKDKKNIIITNPIVIQILKNIDAEYYDKKQSSEESGCNK